MSMKGTLRYWYGWWGEIHIYHDCTDDSVRINGVMLPKIIGNWIMKR